MAFNALPSVKHLFHNRGKNKIIILGRKKEVIIKMRVAELKETRNSCSH